MNLIRAEIMLSISFIFFMVVTTRFHMLKKSSMIFVNHLVYSLSTTNLIQNDMKMEHKFMNSR